MIHLWRMLIYSQMINCFKRKMQQRKNVFAFFKRAHKLHLSSLDIGHEVIKIFIVIFLSNIFFYSQSLFKLCNQHYGLCSKNSYRFHPFVACAAITSNEGGAICSIFCCTSNEGGGICSIFAAQATKGVESVAIFATQPIMLIAEFEE